MPVRDICMISERCYLCGSTPSSSFMQASVSSALRVASRRVSRPHVRAFSSTVPAFQAEPLQKPVLNKEFKIYRWVCSSSLFKGAAEADGNSILGSGGTSKEADSSVVQSRSEPVRANGALLV